MSSALMSSPTAARTVQVWLSDGSSNLEDATADGCLSAAERQLAERLTSVARRRSFETARRLGKRAVRQMLEARGEFPDTIEILSEDPTGTTSRPVVCVDGLSADLSISITHLDDAVAVAVADRGCSIGIDLVQIQQPSQGFAEFWMTDCEQRQVQHSDDPALTASMNWSAREAAFKATSTDEEFRPAHWAVTFDGDQTSCFHRGQRQPVQFRFYRVSRTLLLTVAGDESHVTFHSA